MADPLAGTGPEAGPEPARSFTFLVNPASGGGAAPAAVLPVSRLLRDAGARVEVTYSPGPRAMAAMATGAVGRGDVVVSVGGDGMLSSLAGAVSHAGGTLGVLPAGRGNDFARMLGVPQAPDELAAMLLDGPARPVDLISWSPGAGTGTGTAERRVAGSVYCGVDARAAELVDTAHRWPRRLQYPYAALRALAAYRPADVCVVVDGVEASYAAATVVVANSGYYGKGMLIAPSAVLDDGWLDVVVIEAASKLALMRSLPTVYDGSHVALPEVTVLRGRRVEVSGDCVGVPLGVPVGGDGEPLGTLPPRSSSGGSAAVAQVLPGALSVIAPAPR